jgi:hypothetical protein
MNIIRYVLAVALIAGCGGGDSLPALTANQFCGSIRNQFGPAFFCPTAQANLQTPGMPAGNLGYCAFARENLSITGFSAHSTSGEFRDVESFSAAQDDAAHNFASNSGSTSISQCTRDHT